MRMKGKHRNPAPRAKSKGRRRLGLGENAAAYRAARKRATNVSIDEELLNLARELGINLSQTLEQRLREITKAERERRWREENRAAIEAYNQYIERNGIFGEEFREW
jgi:antitoxin CcdA